MVVPGGDADVPDLPRRQRLLRPLDPHLRLLRRHRLRHLLVSINFMGQIRIAFTKVDLQQNGARG